MNSNFEFELFVSSFLNDSYYSDFYQVGGRSVRPTCGAKPQQFVAFKSIVEQASLWLLLFCAWPKLTSLRTQSLEFHVFVELSVLGRPMAASF